MYNNPNQIEQVIQQALNLRKQDRALLINRLLESVEQETSDTIDRAWVTEIRERVAAYENGILTGRSSDDIIKESRQRLQ